MECKALADKILILGIDGMDPRFTKYMLDKGEMPNLKKLVDNGAQREDLVLQGMMPTITPPMWATLATGAYAIPMALPAFGGRARKIWTLWNTILIPVTARQNSCGTS